VEMRADLYIKNIVAAPPFQMWQQVMCVVKYLYSIIVFFIARYASLWSCGTEEKPSTPRPLPG